MNAMVKKTIEAGRCVLQEKRKYLLLLFPAFYLLLGFYFRNILGDLSLRSLDPDYIYFISGMGISEGHFKVAHVDNPGTPLQYLMGICYRIVYLFRPENSTYQEDIFMNPDLYMAISNLVITGIIASVLFYAGRRIYRSTGSVLYGLLIQATPFLPVIWYDIIGRIVPELLMPLPVIFLEILLIELIYSEKDDFDTRQIIALSVISAFGLSVKLTYFPLWFIPLLLIKTWKRKSLFLGLSIAFFMLFAIPVTLRFSVFTKWIKALFIHSGQYGGGSSNFVNFPEFFANLKFLWSYENWFFVAAAIVAMAATGYLFWRKKDAGSKKVLLVTAAVLLTILLQTGMVCKHFAHRYYIPALLLFPLLIFLIAEFLKHFLNGRFRKLLSVGLILFLIAFSVHQLPWIRLKAEVMGNDIAQRKETWHFVSNLPPNSIKIITTQNYGCPFREYALMVSYAWAGSQQKYYTETLARLYPDSYLYFTWDNTLKYWTEKFDVKKIIDSKKKIYLYIEQDEEELLNKTLAKLDEESETGFTVNSELLYRNPVTTEVIYELNLLEASNITQETTTTSN